jgi:hypothetical protein
MLPIEKSLNVSSQNIWLLKESKITQMGMTVDYESLYTKF